MQLGYYFNIIKHSFAWGMRETGFSFVDSLQGARDEGPADVERANADAQVTHFNERCYLLQAMCVKRRKRWAICQCSFQLGTCRCLQRRLWWHGDEVHEYPVHPKLPTSSQRWKSRWIRPTTVPHWTGLITRIFIFYSVPGVCSILQQGHWTDYQERDVWRCEECLFCNR